MYSKVTLLALAATTSLVFSCKPRAYNEGQAGLQEATATATAAKVSVTLLALGQEFQLNDSPTRRVKLNYTINGNDVVINDSNSDAVVCTSTGPDVACGPFERREKRGSDDLIRTIKFVVNLENRGITLSVNTADIDYVQEGEGPLSLGRTPIPAETFEFSGKIDGRLIVDPTAGFPTVTVTELTVNSTVGPDPSAPDDATKSLRNILLKFNIGEQTRVLNGQGSCIQKSKEGELSCNVKFSKQTSDPSDWIRKVSFSASAPWKKLTLSVKTEDTDYCLDENSVKSLCLSPVLGESFDITTDLTTPILR